MASNSPELKAFDYKMYGVTQQHEYETQVNNIEEIKR